VSGFSIVMALLAGVALGLFFYAGLWLTVRRLLTAEHPVLITLGSFWIRVAAVLAGFVFLARQGPGHVAVAMAGFAAARLAVSRLIPERRPSAKCI